MAETPGKLHRLRHLSAWQWGVLSGSPFILLTTWLSLKAVGYGKTLSRAKPVRQSPNPAEQQLRLARDTAYALAVATNYGPWQPKCLVRSLALGWFLGRKGIPFEVRIGVPAAKPTLAPGGELDFTAHAWVEHAGVVLNDREDIAAQFTAFDPGPGRA